MEYLFYDDLHRIFHYVFQKWAFRVQDCVSCVSRIRTLEKRSLELLFGQDITDTIHHGMLFTVLNKIYTLTQASVHLEVITESLTY